ncbi:hypothetical protein Pla108_13500 [Botrimarina colliarenosi]|uniref:Uncharacterized protein n=1 Tax=Botrimarina colliarenosi TaxID=2528001 RepID=A0A5C6AL72_9BACT|nr:hypothetical protein Pla108_13500 [Botrimarina colliarenosi]
MNASEIAASASLNHCRYAPNEVAREQDLLLRRLSANDGLSIPSDEGFDRGRSEALMSPVRQWRQ